MAADPTLKKNLLRDAKSEGRDTIDAQLAWLDAKRKTYGASVEAGDWEVTSDNYDGASHSSRRGISDKQHLEAILSLMEDLETARGDTPPTSRSSMLSVRISNIQP